MPLAPRRQLPENGFVTNALANLDRARSMLAKARMLDEVKKIVNMAQAAQVYIKAAHLGRDAQYQAAELSLLAAHKAGAILKQLPKAKPKVKGGRTKDSEYWRTINESGIPYRTAQRWQELACVTEDSLERYFSVMRKADKDISAAGLLRACYAKLKRPKGKSPYTHHISIPLKGFEYDCIRDWARRTFQDPEDFLQPEQRFIRECLSEFFKETGMALPLEEMDTIQERLLKWLSQKPISESPLFKEVMKESGPIVRAERSRPATKRCS